MKTSLNEKVSVYRGATTLLEAEAAVSAANGSLLGGGVVLFLKEEEKASTRVFLCIMCTHVFGPNFQEKNLALKFFQFDYLFIYLYSSTCFWYFKRILAFIFEHIMVQEILCNK